MSEGTTPLQRCESFSVIMERGLKRVGCRVLGAKPAQQASQPEGGTFTIDCAVCDWLRCRLRSIIRITLVICDSIILDRFVGSTTLRALLV